MKYFLILFVVLGTVDSCRQWAADSGIAGNWRLSEEYISIGGPGSWRKVADTARHTLSFETGGRFSSAAYPDYVAYAVKDSVTLTLFKEDRTAQEFRFSIRNNTLEMSPSGPNRCIEGCGWRYVRMK